MCHRAGAWPQVPAQGNAKLGENAYICNQNFKAMTDNEYMDALARLLSVPTAASEADRLNDDWDAENCCNYSADGSKLLDAEVFPDVVHVRDGVKVICDGAFAFDPYMADDVHVGDEIPEDGRVSYLDRIFLPPSVTHIGVEAFRECGWLRSIRLPLSLRVIGDGAFAGCWSLRGIACPARVEYIGESAFCECFSLRRVRLDKALKVIGPRAFWYCEDLEEINLPDGLQVIGEEAFSHCGGLRRIRVGKGMKQRFAPLFPKRLASRIVEG